MRRLWLAARLTDIWAELWPAPAWAITITIWHTWYAAAGLTLTLAGITHRYWRRRDYHKNVTDTISVFVRHNWPHQDIAILDIQISQLYTPWKAWEQYRNAGHLGIPAYETTITVRGDTNRDELADWCRRTYEYPSCEPVQSMRGVAVFELRCIQSRLADLVRLNG